MGRPYPDVIVIGAGVVGLFTAWELAEAGLKVTVIERGQPGCEASWAGGGILSPLHPWQYPKPVLDLSRWSQAAYPGIAKTLHESTGIDPEWTNSGLLIQEQDSIQPAQQWGRQYKTPIEILAPDEQLRRYPKLAVMGEAILLPSVSQIRNPRLIKSLIAMLQYIGVQLLTGVEALEILEADGCVRGVRTSLERHWAERIVVAAGAWSAGFKQLQVPVKPIKGQMLLFRAKAGYSPVMVLRGQTYLIPRRDSQLLVGSNVEDVGFDKSPTETTRRHLYAQAKSIYPEIEHAELIGHWAGLRPGSPDGIPFIAECADTKGLFVNTGHSRHGLLTAPASAKLLVALMLNSTPVIPLTAYQA